EDTGHGADAQAFRQRAHRPHQPVSADTSTMQRRAMLLKKISATCTARELSPGTATGLTDRGPPACGQVPGACLATVVRATRTSQEGHHGIPVALSPLVTPSTPAVPTHVATSGHLTVLLPPALRAYTPTGWGHGGTRNSSTSRTITTEYPSQA